MALAMAEVPEQALKESDRAGWVLVLVGGFIALTGPLLRGGWQGTKDAAGTSQTPHRRRGARGS